MARSPGSNAGRTELCRDGQLPSWQCGTSVCQTAFEVGSNSKSAFQKILRTWIQTCLVANAALAELFPSSQQAHFGMHAVHKCGACTRAQFATVLQLQAAVGVSLAAHRTAWGTPSVNLGLDASHRSRFKPLLCGCASPPAPFRRNHYTKMVADVRLTHDFRRSSWLHA